MKTERTPGQRNKAAKAIAWERPGDVLRALPEHMDIWARSDQATLQHLAQAIQKATQQRPEFLLDEWPDKPWLKPALRTEGPDDPANLLAAMDLATQAKIARANRTGDPSAAKKALVAENRVSVEARLLHQLAKTRGAPNGVSALAVVVEALPPQVRAARRLNPILPVVKRLPEVKVGGGSLEREAGQRALGLVPLDHRQGQLPLFGPSAEGPRVALLEMADRAGMVTMAKGRGAPLALRLPVFALLDLPPEHRHDTARVVLKVRELREDLFPGRKDGARQWPRIRKALFRLQNLTVPMEGEARWFPFALRQEPGDRPGLEDEIVIDLALPPGAGHGPPIDREVLRRLGVQSGPRFRALLAVHSVQWRPGRTRVPVPGCRRPYRVWAANPDAYVILTAQDRRRLAFGEDSRKHRTTREQEAAWEDLPGVEVVSKDARDSATGREGWLVVPAEAARAIKGRGNRERSIAGERRLTTGEREVDNRGARGG